MPTHGRTNGQWKKTYYRKMIFKYNIKGITKLAIHRLARHGGVRQTSDFICEETSGILREFLEKVISDMAVYMEHAKHKTVSELGLGYN